MRFIRLAATVATCAAAIACGKSRPTLTATPQIIATANTATQAQAASSKSLVSAAGLSNVSKSLTIAATSGVAVSLAGLPAPSSLPIAAPAGSGAGATALHGTLGAGAVGLHAANPLSTAATAPAAGASGCLLPDASGSSIHVAAGGTSGTWSCPSSLPAGTLEAIYQDGCTVDVIASGTDSSWDLKMKVTSQSGASCAWSGTSFDFRANITTSPVNSFANGTVDLSGAIEYSPRAGSTDDPLNMTFGLNLSFNPSNTGGSANMSGTLTDHERHVRLNESLRISLNSTGTQNAGTEDVSLDGSSEMDFLDSIEVTTLHKIQWEGLGFSFHSVTPSTTPPTFNVSGDLLYDGMRVASLVMKQGGVFIEWTNGQEDPFTGKGMFDLTLLFGLV